MNREYIIRELERIIDVSIAAGRTSTGCGLIRTEIRMLIQRLKRRD